MKNKYNKIQHRNQRARKIEDLRWKAKHPKIKPSRKFGQSR